MDLRLGWGGSVAATIAIGVVAMATPAWGTIRYGNIQISGNLQAQLLFRTPSATEWHWIQERNTFRLQYEHRLVEQSNASDLFEIPFIDQVDLFGYYRGVYDAIYDIKPGGVLENQDGSRGTKFDEIDDGDQARFENNIREVFVDIALADIPLTLRIGKQQISWGEALVSRALDSQNALDVSWHLFFEAGLFGKVGFDELRIPAWTVKAIYNVGSVGPFSDVFVEAYDIPFDFNPTEVRTASDSPWSLPFRNPFRGGLVLDLGESIGLPGGLGLIQPCFDVTGNQETNAEASPDFSETSRSGLCDTPGMQRTTYRRGLYDRRDPLDVNQFGARVSANAPGAITFTLNYMHRRHLGTDIPGAGISKFYSGTVLRNPNGFVELAPHQTFDESRQVATNVIGYLRIPVEIYYPYVEVFGASAVYADDITGAVFNAEGTLTHGLPVFNGNAYGTGIEKRDVLLWSVGADRPISIPWLNRRSAFQTFAQVNFNYIFGHDEVRFGPGPLPTSPQVPVAGDVGIPNSGLIPGAFIDSNDVDELKQLEMLSLLGFAAFYRGGSVNPVVFWISDWANAPAMAWFMILDWYVTNDIILTPRVNIFSTFGRDNVNDPFAIGRSGGAGNRSEVQLRLTYQF